MKVEERHYGIYWIILLGACTLLVLLPSEASLVNTKRGWFIQPMFGAGLGISIVAAFAAIRVIQSLQQGYLKQFSLIEELSGALSNYRTALFSASLFFLYINTLSVLGFILSTLMFVFTLLWLSRLFNRTWILASVFTLLAMVLIFRVAVSVWLPDVWLYGLLPDQWADFANQYL
ncbi:hypothetical protein EHS89_00435 [Amphritea balenae]|uniref:Tripartite tricarboxylate transporter TctB family protein n=1 Tax=Amphritea balenae TaxID=452629 RepID=A0A3P1SX29_9GAMM|nr:hypothetical protein EHS89_00435 [Amphritea balenae]